MEKALIVIGLGIAFLCWITKRDGEYWNNRSEVITKRRAKILQKIENDEALSVFEFLDYYITKTVYGLLKYGMYGGLLLSFIGTALFVFQPLLQDTQHNKVAPVSKSASKRELPTRAKKIYSYSTEYKGLMVGSSTLPDVINVLGKPISKIFNSNNVNYRFDKVDVTISNATGHINTIIIYDTDYVDVNGYSVGALFDDISQNLDVRGTQAVLTEKSNGVIYWFHAERVSKIVYAAQLKL